jgi:hypothetical protein
MYQGATAAAFAKATASQGESRFAFNAKGAPFNVEPGATPQDSREDKREH